MSLKISPVTIVIAVVVIAVLLYFGVDILYAFGIGSGAGAAYETGMQALAGREEKIDKQIEENTAQGATKKEKLKNANRKDGASFFNNLFKRKSKQPHADK